MGTQVSCEYNQHNEVFCDMFATKIIVDHERSHNQGSVKQFMGLPEDFNYFLYELDHACAEMLAGEDYESGYKHPSRRKRLDMMLTNPSVAKMFKCTARDNPCAEEKDIVDCNRTNILPKIKNEEIMRDLIGR